MLLVDMGPSFAFVPLHHPGAGTTEETNFIQGFIDSGEGIFLASLSHTFGALLFTAGIALYLYQARLVRIAKEELEMPSVQWLPLAHILTIAGVGLNGIGGLMRLKQGDHPGLDELGASSPEGTWVTVLLVKHLFLIVGIGLAMWLTGQTFWMSRKAEAPGNFLPHANRITAFAIISFLTIIAATVGGVIAQGALAPQPMDAEGANALGTADDALALGGVSYQNFTGSLSGSAAQPGEAKFDVMVPPGVSQVRVTITWSSELARLDAALADAAGEDVPAQKTVAEPSTGAGIVPMGGRRIDFVVQYEGIPAGVWTLTVTSDQATNEPFRVVTQRTVGDGFNLLEDTISVRGGIAGGEGFYEVNLRMEIGDAFYVEWWLDGSEDPVYFDIHTHDNGQVQYPVQGTWSRYSGNYTHEMTEAASLLWENPGTTPVTIHFVVRGDFEYDSTIAR